MDSSSISRPYIILCTAAVATVAVLCSSLFAVSCSLPWWVALFDAFWLSACIVACNAALAGVVHYGQYGTLNYPVIVVALLFVVFAAGGVWLFCVVAGVADHLFVASLPLRGLTLLLGFMVLFYRKRLIVERQNNDTAESDFAAPQPDTAPQEREPNTIGEQPREETIERISVRNGQKIDIIAVEAIIFLRAEGDYVDIVTREGHHLKEQTMRYFETHLPADSFVRIHRSYIINATKMRRIERYGQQQLVEMIDGEKIRISPSGYKLLREKLGL